MHVEGLPLPSSLMCLVEFTPQAFLQGDLGKQRFFDDGNRNLLIGL